MKVIDRQEANERGLGDCILTGDIDGPFLDTGYLIQEIDPYVTIHVPVVEAMGREVGMVTAKEHDDLKAEISNLQSLVAEYGEKVDELHRALDGADAYKSLVRG